MYNYPPISYYQNGDWGYCFELAKKIFEHKGYQVKPTLYPVIRAISSTVNLTTDAICVINPYNSNRLVLADYPNTRLSYHFWVDVNSDFKYDGIRSLRGKRIINIKGYNYTLPGIDYQQFLEHQENQKYIYQLSGDSPLPRAFKMIKAGRADMICLDEPSALYTLKNLKMENSFKKAGNLPKVLYGYFAVSDSHPDRETLLKIYNEGHVRLVKSGEFRKLLKVYGLKSWPLTSGKRSK